MEAVGRIVVLGLIAFFACVTIAYLNYSYIKIGNKTKDRYETKNKELIEKYKDLENKLQGRDSLIKHQTKKLVEQDKCLNDILKMCDDNEYLNLQVKVNKIKELAQTAINR